MTNAPVSREGRCWRQNPAHERIVFDLLAIGIRINKLETPATSQGSRVRRFLTEVFKNESDRESHDDHKPGNSLVLFVPLRDQ